MDEESDHQLFIGWQMIRDVMMDIVQPQQFENMPPNPAKRIQLMGMLGARINMMGKIIPAMRDKGII